MYENMKYYFGDVKHGDMILNDFGKAFKDIIMKTNVHYKNIELDDYIIMPNHVHIIIVINPFVETGQCPVSTEKNNLRKYNWEFKICRVKACSSKRY